MTALVGLGAGMLGLQLLPPLIDYHSAPQQKRWRHRLHDVEPWIVDLARHGPEHPIWAERRIDLSGITTPAMCVGGWRDQHRQVMIDAYAQLQGPKKLLIGPWTHAMPHGSPVGPSDFLPLALRWWDHWLRDIDTGLLAEPAVTLFAPNASTEWRQFEAWPPTTEEFALATNGCTTLTRPIASSDRVVIAEYQPDPTIGALSGLGGELPPPAPLDLHDDEMRSVCATSAPLPEDVVICGTAHVLVTVAESSTPPARLVVRLTDVHPDERSTFITSGVLTVSEPAETYRLPLLPASYRVRTGHRIRVSISDADFPRLSPPPVSTPIGIVRIEFTAPSLADDAGYAANIPAIPPQAGAASDTWTISRDPIHDGLEVNIGKRTSGHTPGGEHGFETTVTTRARVSKAAPDAATITATGSTTIQLRTGTEIAVTTSIRCTKTTLWVRGDVTTDSEPTFGRTWTLPLASI